MTTTPLARRMRRALAAGLPVAAALTLSAAQYPTAPPPGAKPLPPASTSVDEKGAPRLPPFAGTVVSFDRRGERVVACVDRSTVPMKQSTPPGAAPAPPKEAPKLPPSYRIWLIEREVMQELMTTGGLCDPVWAPDGKSFAAAGARGVFAFTEPNYEARVLALGTMAAPAPPPAATGAVPPPEATVPTTGMKAEPSKFSQLAWSPTGRRVAFLSHGDGGTTIRVVEAKDGSGVLSKAQPAKLLQWGSDDRTLVVDGTRTAIP